MQIWHTRLISDHETDSLLKFFYLNSNISTVLSLFIKTMTPLSEISYFLSALLIEGPASIRSLLINKSYSLIQGDACFRFMNRNPSFMALYKRNNLFKEVWEVYTQSSQRTSILFQGHLKWNEISFYYLQLSLVLRDHLKFCILSNRLEEKMPSYKEIVAFVQDETVSLDS